MEPRFYDRPVLDVARDLLGCVVLGRGGTTGVIVETEAYHQTEPASHAFVGVSSHNRNLFGPPGTAYVYRSYGIHVMLNAVCEGEGVGAAALIRALAPLDGVDVMGARRGHVGGRGPGELCSGPGKLAQALGVELGDDGTSLLDGPVRIVTGDRRARLAAGAGTPAEASVAVGRRVGITKAADLPWRFWLAGNRFVSRPRP